MFTVAYSLVMMSLPSALLFFPIMWLLMRRKNGRTLEVTHVWLIAGLLFTAIAARLIRFMAILVIGKESALSPVGNIGIVFYLALPIIVATAV